MGVIVLAAGGGLGIYLSSQHSVKAAQHHSPARPLSPKVLKVQTIGLIDFGPYDDGDQTANDRDDHPLMLKLTGNRLAFVKIPRSELAAGVPLWTADQMADGTEIFIYIPNGRCLTAAQHARTLELAHCDLAASQRWRAIHQRTVERQSVVQFRSLAGNCLTAGPRAGPAKLARCGPARTRPQEVAFWWGA